MNPLSSKNAVSFLLLVLSGCTPAVSDTNILEKVYVAVEGENRITVLNPKTRTVIRTIDLSMNMGDTVHEFSPHNVQAAPDGKSVWVTANRGHGDAHGAGSDREGDDMHGEHAVTSDQVIVIEPLTDTIIKRIPVDPGIHLAHVVITKDGSFAYATAQERGMIYKIDARTFEIAGEIRTQEESEPHGLRLSPDDTIAYIAMLQGKALGILNLRTDTLTAVPLAGNAVQTGITPDGKSVIISLYDTKQIAVFDVATKKVSTIDLPSDAMGPIQMYPTPDSRFVYVADQGYYFGQPTGNRVFKIDLAAKNVVKQIPTGDAPHGVVVSPDGKSVYVTNLLTQDVSIIDTTTDTEVDRIGVGKIPNGISIWSRSPGGTP